MQNITKQFKGLAEISTYLRKENPTFLICIKYICIQQNVSKYNMNENHQGFVVVNCWLLSSMKEHKNLTLTMSY